MNISAGLSLESGRRKGVSLSGPMHACSLACKKDFIADSVVSHSKVTAVAISERVVSFYIHHLATEGAGERLGEDIEA